MGVLADKVVIKAGDLSPGSSGRQDRRGQFLTVLLEGQRCISTSTLLRQNDLVEIFNLSFPVGCAQQQ